MTSACDVEPCAFVRSFVERRGGLAERTAHDGEARLDLALPDDLAGRLGTSAFAQGAEVGHGSPIFERALEAVRQGCVHATASAHGLHLRTDGALRTIESRILPQNARLRAISATRRRTSVLAVWARFSAVSDEMREGLVAVAVDARDLTSVPGLEAALAGKDLRPEIGEVPALSREPTRIARALARDLVPALERERAPFVEVMRRRVERDAARVERYYAGLLAELADPRRLRRVRSDAEAAAARQAEGRRAIESERDRRMADVARRYAVRADVTIAGVLRIDHDEIACEVEVKRRQTERRLTIGWSPWLADLKPLACEHCLAEMRAFHACDDAAHLLCARCHGKECPVCRTEVSRARP